MARTLNFDIEAIRDAFFADIVNSIDFWASDLAKDLVNSGTNNAASESKDVFKIIQSAIKDKGVSEKEISDLFFEILKKYTHSLIVILDGGTSVSEASRLHLVCDNGKPLGEGLHEEFYSYLTKIGRIKPSNLPSDFDPSKY